MPLPDQLPYGFSDIRHINASADAVPLGPLVDDGEDRHGVGILDTARKVTLAGDGDDRLGPLIVDLLPRYGPPRRDEEVDVELLGEGQQVADLALHAADAVLHILGHLDLAVLKLDTVGKKDEEPLRFQPLTHAPDELIVYLDKGLFDTYLGNPEDTPHHNHEGEEELDEGPPHPIRLEDVPPLYDGYGEDENPTHDSQNNCRQEAAEGVWKEGVDIAEADGGDIPGEEEEEENYEGGEGEETQEYPFPRPVVDTLGITLPLLFPLN